MLTELPISALTTCFAVIQYTAAVTVILTAKQVVSAEMGTAAALHLAVIELAGSLSSAVTVGVTLQSTIILIIGIIVITIITIMKDNNNEW